MPIFSLTKWKIKSIGIFFFSMSKNIFMWNTFR
jgi:hypothetical protein